MSEKMFISYNHEDSDLVDSIARRIEIEFGRKNQHSEKISDKSKRINKTYIDAI